VGGDALLYGSATLISRGTQLLLVPVYTRFVAPAEYGVLEMVVVLGALVNLTVALEISQGVARSLADARDGGAVREYASTALLFSLGAYGLFALGAVTLAGPLAALLLGHAQWAEALRVAVAALAVNGVFVLAQDLLRWRLRPGAYLRASAAYALVSAAVGIYLVAVAGLGVHGVFWGQVAGAVAGAAVALPALGDSVGLAFRAVRLREMLAYSLPLVGSGVAVFANLFVDRIAIRELLGIAPLGVYAVGARVASVVGLATVALQAALTPLVFRSYREPGTPPTLARLLRYYGAAAAVAVGALAVFSGELVAVFAGPAFQEARQVLPVLAGASLLATLYIFAPGPFLRRRTGLVAAINAAGAALNVTLNLWLIPVLGIVGAAFAACASAAAVFGLSMAVSQSLYPVPHRWPRLAVALAIAGVGIALGAGLHASAPQPGMGLVVAKLLLMGLLAGAALGVLEREERALAWSWLRRRALGARP
jgi:O-antigen/teichoic acid export membrane protein